MHIKVLDTNVVADVNRKTGEVRGYLQKAGLMQGQFAIPFDVPVVAGQPYPVGDYTLDASSFRLNQYGGLELNRYELKLVALRPAAAKAA